MKISQEVRDYADALDTGIEAAKQQGMDEMSQKFQEMGGEVYIPAEQIKSK
jgi:phosphomethylpyrimidine synthase